MFIPNLFMFYAQVHQIAYYSSHNIIITLHKGIEHYHNNIIKGV